MVEREIEITNRLGLHARAAAKLVHIAGRFESKIILAVGGERVDGKSILGILLLAAAQGSKLTINCEGRDEAEAAAALCTLIADKFGEEN